MNDYEFALLALMVLSIMIGTIIALLTTLLEQTRTWTGFWGRILLVGYVWGCFTMATMSVMVR